MTRCKLLLIVSNLIPKSLENKERSKFFFLLYVFYFAFSVRKKSLTFSFEKKLWTSNEFHFLDDSINILPIPFLRCLCFPMMALNLDCFVMIQSIFSNPIVNSYIDSRHKSWKIKCFNVHAVGLKMFKNVIILKVEALERSQFSNIYIYEIHIFQHLSTWKMFSNHF